MMRRNASAGFPQIQSLALNSNFKCRQIDLSLLLRVYCVLRGDQEILELRTAIRTAG
jgi:hypothetical protein